MTQVHPRRHCPSPGSIGRRAFLTTLAASAGALAAETEAPAALRDLAGQCLLVGFHGPACPQVWIDHLRRGALGGVLLTSGNFVGLEGLRNLTRVVRACAPPGAPPPLIAADQEGGPVSHLTPPLAPMVSMPFLGAIDDLELTRRAGAVMGCALRGVGVNFDLAPVLDVRTNTDNLVVLGRTFGGGPERVARHGVALIEGLRASGIMACAKHFPGHGGTREDSHESLPRVTRDRAALESVELVPFRAALSSAPAMMMAHVVYEALDSRRPASLSSVVVEGLLRSSLGYAGVVVSDDLEMAPIRTGVGVPAAAVMAIEAGCDLALIAHNIEPALWAITAMAQRALTDAGFHAKLLRAAARIAGLKRSLDVLERIPPNPFAQDPWRFFSEVTSRRRDPLFRDPTR